MLAIIKKEIQSYFSSAMGFLVIALFLGVTGLFLWVFRGDFNILNLGFADLSPFFNIAPWVFMFLIPAITMQSFSEEKKQGTFELLLTKPITHTKLVFGKFLASFVLVVIALLPTLIYVYTVKQLGNPEGNLDMASTWCSYLGLLFLASVYSAIGVFASTLTNNQIVAFLLAVLLCFVSYFGFSELANITNSTFVENLGIQLHYSSISRGVIDTRDIVYFLCFIIKFIVLAVFSIKIQAQKPFQIKTIGLIIVGLLLFYFIGNTIYKRFDLTSDKRYTLSESTLNLVESIETPVLIDVFLEGEEFPSEFKRLKAETTFILEEFKKRNSAISYHFIDPLEDPKTRNQNIKSLMQRGLTPMQLNVSEQGSSKQSVIIPWALASFNDNTVKIPLIKNKIGATQQELVSQSVQHLEYAFADGLNKLVNPKRKKIAIIKGNGELEDKYIYDFVKTLRDYYFIAPFTLDSVASNPIKTTKALSDFDLAIVAKPTEAFSEDEKFALDQFTMQGGKSLWLLDKVAIEQDSLLNASGKNVAIPRDLNLTDFFFAYGVRINSVLVNDLYSEKIALASGSGSKTQFEQWPWFYSPLVNSNNAHPIVNNLNLVKFDFANQIDTLKNTTQKTVLLQSSILSKLEGVPREISLEDITIEPDPKAYTKGFQNLAVLLEGTLNSAYKNRIKPFDYNETTDQSQLAKMIVIADGNVIQNTIGKNGPDELGFNPWTGQVYGNKEFLLNSVNYLLDETGLINIRSKAIKVAFLDLEKASAQKTKWQLVNILIPLVLIVAFGLLYQYYRKKKYAF